MAQTHETGVTIRQAEQALRESEAQFRVLADAIPQLCWMAKPDGWIFWYNQRWYEYTGTTPEQMEGWGWQSVHDPEELPRVLERWKASLATGEPLDMVFPLRGADGVFRPFLTRVMPLRDSSGKVARWFGSNTDISEQRKALLESEERFRNLFDSMEEGFTSCEMIYDEAGQPIDFRYLAVNPAFARLIGLAAEQVVGRTVRQAIPEIEPSWIETYGRIVRTGNSERFENQLAAVGKTLELFAWRSGPGQFAVVFRDITERKRAEEALQQKTDLINYSHDAIVVADANRVITMWNTGAEEIYGWTEAEAIGTVMHQLLPTGSRVSIEDIDRKLTRDGRWDGEIAYTRRDGKQIIVESRQILRRDAAGAPIGILEINRDISDRKRLEEQFRQAQKLEGIGRLAGGLAHDFNNLLTVISGYSQMILDEIAVQHPLRESMEQISKAAARATGLTRQLLIFSRSQVTEPRNIVLNDVVQDFEKMLRRLIGEDINLVLSLDPGAGTIRADAGQIEQVILNLAVNARDAMPRGGTLSIETTSLLADKEFAQNHLSVQPGLYVVLVVSDTGVGMSPEVESRLFEPFFTTKEVGKGTGLGLSTVYGIVKQSGGSIWVYSEPGLGTTFRMLFPAIEAEAGPAPDAPVEAPSGSETILVAEDEPDVRGFIRRILERRGYTVLEASNGREALEVARKHTGAIHLMMADVVMPEMGGAELADQFGAEHPGVPVLFMSGYTNHFGRCEEIGAGYLQKPFTSASLLTQVRTVLDAV